MLYLSILDEYYVHRQIPQNRVRVVKVPAVVHVPLLVLSDDARAESGNAHSSDAAHSVMCTRCYCNWVSNQTYADIS